MLYLFFLLIPLTSYADPWGKDADLAKSICPVAICPCQPTVLEAISTVLVRFHQEVISPCDGPRSHFKPSSSQYALDAICKYGFLTGFGLGCDRLMRENSEEWVYRKTKDGAGHSIKYDPVP